MRRARERHGVSLEELGRRTKIPLPRLVALELADVPNLPAAVYTRGFVRAYAAEVGLPPDATASEYLAAVTQAAYPPVPLESPMPAIVPGRVHEIDVGRRIVAEGNRLPRLMTVGAAIGLLVYVVTINRLAGRQTTADTADSTVLTSAGSNADPLRRDAQAPSVVVAETAAVTDGPLDLQLLSRGPCWLMLTVDGQRVLMRLVGPGERLSFSVTEVAQLRVGDPSAMLLTINGRSVRALGPPGQPVNVTISKKNLKELLNS
jgi:hypothetical protein